MIESKQGPHLRIRNASDHKLFGFVRWIFTYTMVKNTSSSSTEQYDLTKVVQERPSLLQSRTCTLPIKSQKTFREDKITYYLLLWWSVLELKLYYTRYHMFDACVVRGWWYCQFERRAVDGRDRNKYTPSKIQKVTTLCQNILPIFFEWPARYRQRHRSYQS